MARSGKVFDNKKDARDLFPGVSFLADDAENLLDSVLQTAIVGHSPVTQPLILHFGVDGQQPAGLVLVGDVPLQQGPDDILFASPNEHGQAAAFVGPLTSHSAVDVHGLDSNAPILPDIGDLALGDTELDVKKYGVIVSCGGRRGLLLPDLDGVDTVEQQIDIARQKGGISSREKFSLERFEVVRHT